jgi:hypothetical protein
MKNIKRVKPSLPNMLVKVDKGSRDRQVLVGILNGNRMPAFGIDVRGMAPNHYRIVEPGKFGVLIGARQPIEVRVLLDGKLLLESELKAYENPSAKGDPELRRRMMEAPHPHYLMHDSDGKPFMFEGPPTDEMSVDEIIAEQIHSGVMKSPPTLAQIDEEGQVFEEFRLDLDPANFGLTSHDPASDISLADRMAREAARLAAEDTAADVAPELAEKAAEGDEPIQDVASTEDGAAGKEKLEQIIDPFVQSKSWAPSHGLVAVGIRMMQSLEEHEMIPTAPDGFVYTLFQLNPWWLHNKVHARVMGRVIVPSVDELRQMTIDEGYEDELPGHGEHVSCGLRHRHNHR